MRISSAIGTIALAVFTVLIIIAFVSMYQSTYGSLGTVHESDNSFVMQNGSLYIHSNISGKNMGYFPEIIKALNNTFTVSPGKDNGISVFIPVDLQNLYNSSWPVHNASLPFFLPVSIASILMSASENFNNTLSVGAPFQGFSIAGVGNLKGNSNVSNLSASFKDFFPTNLNLTSIRIFQNDTRIGTISLPTMTFGNNYTLTGEVNLTGSAPSLSLNFKAGPFSWNIGNITVSQNSSKN